MIVHSILNKNKNNNNKLWCQGTYEWIIALLFSNEINSELDILPIFLDCLENDPCIECSLVVISKNEKK